MMIKFIIKFCFAQEKNTKNYNKKFNKIQMKTRFWVSQFRVSENAVWLLLIIL